MFVFHRILSSSRTIALLPFWLYLGTGLGNPTERNLDSEVVVAGTTGLVTESRYSCGLTSPVPPVSLSPPLTIRNAGGGADAWVAPGRFPENENSKSKFGLRPNVVPS